MNALEKLLKTKEQIDEEIEKEHQALIQAEAKQRQEKALREAEIIQSGVDSALMSQVEEIVTKMKSILGDKYKEKEFPLYLFALTFHLIDRQKSDLRNVICALESLNRRYKTE